MTAQAPADLPVPGQRRAWWLREALAAERPSPLASSLFGDATADVAIVGGGYTGMWTAYLLGEMAPQMHIVLLEADICGGGPSGRNGGFLHGWWEYLPYLVERYGKEEGLRIAEASDEVVAGIGEWCERHGVDAWFTPSGYLRVNAFPKAPNDWGGTVGELERLGARGQLRHLDRQAVQRMCASPAFGEGLFMPSAATVQPALLARGLRRVLIDRGVQIHEGTAVQRLDPRPGGIRLATARGSVTADRAVLAVNAWAAGWPGFRTRVLAWGSYIVLTEPIPDRLAALGWTGGEAIADSRFTISYFRTTRDGRIAFGAGVGAAGFGGRIGPVFTHDQRAIERVAANFRHLFPMLADVRIDDAWGGPIDITADRFPEIGSTHGGRVLYAHGFAGNGVGPARLAGRILAARIARGDDPIASLPIFGRRQRFLPPEPFRSVGARVVREALIRQDDALDAGRRPGLLTRLVTRVPGLMGYRFEH
ncbi:MAG: NAD(P)/FAD-dependent oxidoreductase [Candidatus Limnocylindria bacterium]